MGKALNAATLSVHTAKETIRIIEERADGLGMKKSKYAALILERWIEAGCPPVSDADRALQLLKGKTSSKKAG